MQESNVVTVKPDVNAWHIADEMDAHAVGSVVVVDDAGAPIGIITDRDLVRRVVAKGLDEEKTSARDIMTADLIVAEVHEDGPLVLERMRKHGVRRMPLVDKGKLVGISSIDDILGSISSALWNISSAIQVELRESARTTARRRRGERRAEFFEEARTYLHNVRGGEAKSEEFRGFLDWLSRGPS